MEIFADQKIAHLTILLLFIFPTSFFFSCFYTESLFLVLSVASYTLAYKHKWTLAGIATALLTLDPSAGDIDPGAHGLVIS
jgi:Gpi18-like mannosyltransferase